MKKRGIAYRALRQEQAEAGVWGPQLVLEVVVHHCHCERVKKGDKGPAANVLGVYTSQTTYDVLSKTCAGITIMRRSMNIK